MEFFNSAVDTLQTIVIGLGGALCVWGGVNLLEGYGQDNPHIRFIVHYDMPEDEVVYRLHEMQVGQLADNPVIHNLCLA